MSKCFPVFTWKFVCYTVALLVIGLSLRADPETETGGVTNDLLVLENASGRLVVSRHGGTVLEYRSHGLSSPLDVDWKLAEDSDKVPPPSPQSPHFGVKGHTTWVAPQDEWWKHQKIGPDRGRWPPDPWLTTAVYEIIRYSETQLVLQSPKSPVSGVQMTKMFALLDDGRAEVDATITNIRDKDIQWGIWSNTRVNPHAVVLVPISENTPLKFEFETRTPLLTRAWDYEVTDGFWLTDTRGPYADAHKRGGKVFIDSAEGIAAAAYGNNIFIKRAISPTKVGKSAHGHATVEIFYHRASATDILLELELHGPLINLLPGDSLLFRETWEIVSFEGEPTIENIILSLRRHIK